MERAGLVQAEFSPRKRVGTGADVLTDVIANFPHFKTVKEMTSLDPLKIHYFLLSQRLLRRDAYIDVGEYCFRLSDATYANTSERKKPKKGAPKSFIPITDYETTEPLSRSLVRQDQIAAAIDSLNPGRVKSCGNQIVAKGKLIALVKLVNRELLATCEGKKSRSPFDNNRLRLAVITNWVNWTFQYKYGITSTYSREQVRQMIKSKNIHGGRIELAAPSFESEITEFYRQH